jgi:hypothetical protein
MSQPLAASRTRAGRRPQHLHLFVLGVAVGVTALVVVWLVAKGGKSHASGAPERTSTATLVSQAQLERFASSLDYPVYWAGPKRNFSYELTSANGRVWVRYLPAGVRAGDPRPDFLVVGTYLEPHAYANLQHAAKQVGSVSRALRDGGLLVYSSQRPTSVYFSYPGVRYQVEVYAPSAATARSLVLRGETTPVR